MKPDAPAGYRGDFRPVRTNVPGIDYTGTTFLDHNGRPMPILADGERGA